MDYEQKYKKALERAKLSRLQLLDIGEEATEIEYIFPELVESKDEKIRKALISILKSDFEKDTTIYDISIGDIIAWLEKLGDKDKLIKELGEYKVKYTQEVLKRHLNSVSNKDDEILRAIAFLKDFADKGYENAVECIDWLEKQGKLDVSNNEFKVTTGLYKCVKRMFDGTPDGKLIFEVGNIYKCLSKHDRAEFEVSYGHSVYLEDPVVCKHFIPFEKQGEKYDGQMDKECIALCDTLNRLPNLQTFESCCGHLKERYSIWFFCDNIDTISRLGRCVDQNYSDGKWEIIVDSSDTNPKGVFWLRSKKPFKTYNEMNDSIERFIESIPHWFKKEFDSYFKGEQEFFKNSANKKDKNFINAIINSLDREKLKRVWGITLDEVKSWLIRE